ncbi:VanZ family protein [Tundrisphaera lichenicola]|uniref:VanZ family protein n=1 Tax=Tundrisphaera lichenicola TaxID=2029860 RepID=UPI003EBF59F7
MTFRSFLAGSWTLVILGLCWFPRSLMPVEESTNRSFVIPHFDKLVHLGIFAVFAFLWMTAARSPRRVVWVLAAGVAMAIISEMGQELPIVDRDANLMDGVADTLGVGLGVLAYRFLGRFSGPEA